MKHISRIDSKNTHGWFVRLYQDGETHSKFFSDGVHGGREKALKVATKYRDQYIKEHNIQYLPYFEKPMKSNKTGVSGVSESFHTWRSGKKVPCYIVFWAPKPNERKTKYFYPHHFNNKKEAFKAAVEFRKEREREILRDHKKRLRAEKRAARLGQTSTD